jgi:hypothetical protein
MYEPHESREKFGRKAFLLRLFLTTHGIRDPKRRAVEGIRSLRTFVPSVAIKNSTTEHHY